MSRSSSRRSSGMRQMQRCNSRTAILTSRTGKYPTSSNRLSGMFTLQTLSIEDFSHLPYLRILMLRTAEPVHQVAMPSGMDDSTSHRTEILRFSVARSTICLSSIQASILSFDTFTRILYQRLFSNFEELEVSF